MSAHLAGPRMSKKPLPSAHATCAAAQFHRALRSTPWSTPVPRFGGHQWDRPFAIVSARTIMWSVRIPGRTDSRGPSGNSGATDTEILAELFKRYEALTKADQLPLPAKNATRKRAAKKTWANGRVQIGPFSHTRIDLFSAINTPGQKPVLKSRVLL